MASKVEASPDGSKRRRLSNDENEETTPSTSPIVELWNHHQDVFEQRLLPFLSDDPRVFLAMSKTCTTFNKAFSSGSDSIWTIVLEQLRKEREVQIRVNTELFFPEEMDWQRQCKDEYDERQAMEEYDSDDEQLSEDHFSEQNMRERASLDTKLSAKYHVDKRYKYIDSEWLSTPFQKIWCGQVKKHIERFEDCDDDFGLLEHFQLQFGDKQTSAPHAFRQQWLLPLAGCACKSSNTSKKMDIALSDDFVEAFALLLGIKMALYLYDANEHACNLIDEKRSFDVECPAIDLQHIQFLEGVSSCFHDHAIDQVDNQFPLPYNFAIVRKLTYDRDIVRISNSALQRIWATLICLSTMLMETMLAQHEADMKGGAHIWTPTCEDLERAAEKLGVNYK